MIVFSLMVRLSHVLGGDSRAKLQNVAKARSATRTALDAPPAKASSGPLDDDDDDLDDDGRKGQIYRADYVGEWASLQISLKVS